MISGATNLLMFIVTPRGPADSDPLPVGGQCAILEGCAPEWNSFVAEYSG